MPTTDQGRCVHCYRVTGFFHPHKKEWMCIPKCPPPCTPSDPEPDPSIFRPEGGNRKERRAKQSWNKHYQRQKHR